MSLVDELEKLEALRRRGTLSDAEFQQAKATLLASGTGAADQALEQDLSKQLAEMRHQSELARLDREWAIEREEYLVRSRYGLRVVPSRGMGLASAVFGGTFGMIWTVMAVSITSGAPNFGPFAIAKVAFPLFGVVFVAIAVGWGVQCIWRAQKYEEAFQRFQARRKQLSPERYSE